MFSLDPDVGKQGLGDARLATWEWIADSDELRWTSGQTEIYSLPSSKLNTTAAWHSIVHPDDRERVRRAAQRAIETESGFPEQFPLDGQDGNRLGMIGDART